MLARLKISRKNLLLAVSFAVFLTQSCASTDEQQSDVLANENTGNVADSAEDSADGEAVNNAGGNEFSDVGGEGEGQDFDIGEEVNNAGGNEFAEGNQLNLGNQGLGQAAMNQGGNTQGNNLSNQGNAAALAEAGNNTVTENGLSENTTTNSTALAAENTTASNLLSGTNTAAVATDLSATATVPTSGGSGGSVKYVRAPVQATDAPGSGNVVKTLEKGDHPLVFDEAGYAKMTNGTYIPTDALSVEGVGRDRGDGGWNR